MVDTERTKEVFVGVSGEAGASQVISVSEMTAAGAVRTIPSPSEETSLQIGSLELEKEEPETVRMVPPVLGAVRGETALTVGVPV